MARRKKQSVAEDIMDAVARLPWWVGAGLALISYLIFHWLATRPQPAISDPRQIAGGIKYMMAGAMGKALQFLIPMLCLFGALLSFMRRKKRTGLVADVTQSASADSLNGMSWQDFERLVGEGFRLQGYEITEHGGAQGDGGVDLVLRRGRETFLVQCKQWRALKVGVDVVRQLYGVMAAQGAAGGIVVTSGSFTNDATAFAAGRNLRLVDGSNLFGMLQQAKASLGAKPASIKEPPLAAVTKAQSPPLCPACNSAMVLRTARKGATPGSQFWGCSTFPACRGTR